jgi:hypothetical protein
VYGQAEAIFKAIDHRPGLVALDLHRAYLGLYRGDVDAVRAAVAEATPLAAQSPHIRFALRLVQRALSAAATPGLTVGPEARWFRVAGGARVDLAGRDSLRLVLLCLLDAHKEMPGDPVASADLLTSGWPGERVLRTAGALRVRAAVSTLRKLGLRSALLSRAQGWLIDPALVIARDAASNSR